MKYRASIFHLLKISKKLILPLTGLVALVWFMIRVIPKPSRAFYPCQRAAFPLASAFVVWLFTMAGSVLLFRKGKSLIKRSKFKMASILVIASLIAFGTSIFIGPKMLVFSKSIDENSILIPEMKKLLTPGENTATPLSTVAIVKSSKNTAAEIDLEDIREMVIQAVQYAGGLDDLISDGDTVVIKPNLVYDRASGPGDILESEINGVTSDWRIIKVISELVRELNPNGKIFVMEGSAISTEHMFDVMNYNSSSMPEVDQFFCLESSSGGWRDQNAPELKVVNLPEDKKLYPDNEKPYNSSEYYLNKIYYNADVLISVPLVKNHESASVTGSIKNLCIGTSPANIYGLSETNNNRGTINHGSYLHDYLHDFYLCRPADFAIMDGLQGLEYGPVVATNSQSYQACLKNMRMILASKDLLALDAIEALLESYDPAKIKYMVNLHNDDAGCADPTLIKVIGAKVADERQDFKHSQSTTPKFKDNILPDFSISSIYLLDDYTLVVRFDSKQNIDKIEVNINGEAQQEFYINNFDSLLIDVSNYSIDESTNLTLVAYNEYLSYKEFSATDILSVNSYNSIVDKLRVYPTAVIDRLYIDGISRNAMLSIYSLDGKLIKSENISANNVAMDLSYLETGYYLIRISEDQMPLYNGKIYKY